MSSKIEVFPEIQAIANRLKVCSPNYLSDFLIISFEEEDRLDYSTLCLYKQYYYELVIDLTKNCTFVIENNRIAAKKNRVTLIKPFQLQKLESHTESHEETARGYTLFFTSAFIESFNDWNQLTLLNGSSISSFSLSELSIREVENLVTLIQTEYKTFQSDISSKIIKKYLEILLLKLQKNHDSTVAISTDVSNSQKIYSDFLYAVNENFTTLTTIKEYASELNISPNHLSETVKKISGVNAFYFIDEARLNRSKSLLTQTDLSIKEIAEALSFSNANNFSAYFKSKTGLSPSGFREI